MNIFILGMGHVGKALAVRLRGAGHTVMGSTTTPGKVEELEQYADRVAVLKGSETERLVEAAEGCDAIIVTVAPNVKNTRTIEERHQHYNEVLVQSCASAAQGRASPNRASLRAPLIGIQFDRHAHLGLCRGEIAQKGEPDQTQDRQNQ